MEYTVKQLGDLAGVSGRTLRYYDQIDLLKPSTINQSGYRIYGPKEVSRLQQILLFRELGLDLCTIKRVLDSPSFNERKFDRAREALLQKEAAESVDPKREQTLAALKDHGRSRQVCWFQGEEFGKRGEIR